MTILDPNRLFEVELDILKYTIGAILGQRDEKGRFYPYTYLLHKFSNTKRRYGTLDQKLLAIILAYRQ